jgi:hypothetical protein
MAIVWSEFSSMDPRETLALPSRYGFIETDDNYLLQPVLERVCFGRLTICIVYEKK